MKGDARSLDYSSLGPKCDWGGGGVGHSGNAVGAHVEQKKLKSTKSAMKGPHPQHARS